MTDTKTITFEGRSYTVPFWVEWVARDENGIPCGYDTKPRRCNARSQWKNSDKNRGIYIYPRYDWRDSLTKV